MKTLKDRVDAIIAANAGLGETDRNVLMTLTEAQADSMLEIRRAIPTANFELKAVDGGKATFTLKAAAPAAAPQPAAPAQNAPAPAPAPAPAQQQPQVLNVEAYIAQAPSEVREVLQNSMNSLNEEKGRLVEAILANTSNPYSKEELNVKPIGELRKLARLASAGVEPQVLPAHYAGMAPTQNRFTENAEEPLDAPVMNFEKPKAA